MRKILVVLAAAAVLTATACAPTNLEIDLTVRRGVTVRTVNGQTTVTVSGVSACSGGSRTPTWWAADREPLDTFVTISQGNRSVDAQDYEVALFCSVAPKVWTLTWTLDDHDDELVAGPAVIDVWVTTNPGERIDEAAADDREPHAMVTVAP